MRFGVFGDVFVLIKPKIAIISVCVKRIFARSLNRINTSGAFLEYAEKTTHVLKQIRTFNNDC